jgi:hypothetical protein
MSSMMTLQPVQECVWLPNGTVPLGLKPFFSPGRSALSTRQHSAADTVCTSERMGKSMADLIFDSPVVISCRILTVWLDSSSLARLDCAMCSRTRRTAYIALLQSNQFAFDRLPSTSVVHTDRLFRWLTMRHARIRYLDINPMVSDEVLRQFLTMAGSTVQKLLFSEGANTSLRPAHFNICHELCLDLIEIDASECFLDVSLHGVLQSSQHALTALFCDRCRNVNPAIFAELTFSALHTLTLDNSDAGTAAVLAALKAVPKVKRLLLESLVLECNPITTGLQQLSHLKVLSLRRSLWLTDDAVRQIALSCTNLTVVNVAKCPALTDKSIEHLAFHCTKLQRLYMHHNENFTDAAVCHLAMQRMETLVCLHCSHCPGISADGVCYLLRGCAKITTLQVGGGENDPLRGDRLLQVIRACKNVTNKLALWCEVVGDPALEAVSYYCRDVHHLTLQNATGYTAVGLMALVSECKNLQTILLSQNQRVCNEFAKRLWMHFCPKLRISTDPQFHEYTMLQKSDL